MKRVGIGGQAVLEGIMMKGPESYALAVRKEDGEIATELTPYISFGERKKLNRIPIVRGVVNFVESLYIGIKTLMASSEYFLDEEEDDKKSGKKEKGPEKEAEAAPEMKEEKKEKKEDSKGFMIVTLFLSLAFAIGVFVLLPSFLSNLLYKVTDSDILVNVSEGLLRGHVIVSVGILFDHRKLLPGRIGKDLIQLVLYGQDMIGADLDIRGLALETAQRLVDHDLSVRKSIPLALCACREQYSAHAGRHTHADGADVGLYEPHGVIDSQAGSDHSAG